MHKSNDMPFRFSQQSTEINERGLLNEMRSTLHRIKVHLLKH